MPTHSEAFRLNLEYYRKQAKNLLKAVKSGDREAAERLAHSRHAVQPAQSCRSGAARCATGDRARARICQLAAIQGISGTIQDESSGAG